MATLKSLMLLQLLPRLGNSLGSFPSREGG
jgi:hypothetical protein